MSGFTATSSFADEASDAPLPPLALFARCYGQLTRMRLPARPNATTRPLAADLKTRILAGQISGEDACVALLDAVKLNANGLLINDNAETRAILQNFNLYHSVWFPSDNYQSVLTEGEHYINTGDIHDPTQPGLFFTHALFSDADFTEVVTGETPMEALRDATTNSSNDNFTDSQSRANKFLGLNVTAFEAAKQNCQSMSGAQKTSCQNAIITGVFGRDPDQGNNPGGVPMRDSSIDPMLFYVQKGNLMGVRPMNSTKLGQTAFLFAWVPPAFNNTGTLIPSSTWDQYRVAYNQSFGGGLLGTPAYLMLNWGRDRKEPIDGGIAMPRRWSKAIFNSLLCRDLPLLRVSDVAPIVQSETTRGSNLPFRKGSSCMSCHASIDTLGGVARTLTLREANTPGDTGVNSMHMVAWKAGTSSTGRAADTTALPTAAGSMTTVTDLTDADAGFHRRPTKGVLFYRDINGNLVNEPLNSIADLGVKLTQHDDLYACVAKRYLEFFTGVSVALYDPGDPTRSQPSPSELAYRKVVLDLAQKLRQGNKLRDLAEQILRLDLYKKSGMRGAEGGQ